MTIRRRMIGAAGAAATLAPLAAAPAANAEAQSCGGNPMVCFAVVAPSAGLKVNRVVVYTRNASAAMKRVTVQMYLLYPLPPPGDGWGRDPFKTQTYDLPKAAANSTTPLPQTYVDYCNGLLGGTLPNSSFVTPCHTWKDGYRLGARFWQNGKLIADLQQVNKTISIHK